MLLTSLRILSLTPEPFTTQYAFEMEREFEHACQEKPAEDAQDAGSSRPRGQAGSRAVVTESAASCPAGGRGWGPSERMAKTNMWEDAEGARGSGKQATLRQMQTSTRMGHGRLDHDDALRIETGMFTLYLTPLNSDWFRGEGQRGMRMRAMVATSCTSVVLLLSPWLRHTGANEFQHLSSLTPPASQVLRISAPTSTWKPNTLYIPFFQPKRRVALHSPTPPQTMSCLRLTGILSCLRRQVPTLTNPT